MGLNLTPKERVIDSMERLAWPVVHGSLSTILGVTVLAFINSYMVLVFFKTIFLVLIIEVFHALVLLPIVLKVTHPYVENLIDESKRNLSRDRRENTEKPSGYAIQHTGQCVILNTYLLRDFTTGFAFVQRDIRDKSLYRKIEPIKSTL
ncbi:unnamed protein product, partial [Mesorhabditis belari]|uniref:Uncharacterized protein n=1 Tax=Mesorhabditis belari TaxID=2138241 RepID=A0AAF3FNZ3_9BILA